MRLHPPPLPSLSPSWRELYVAGRFAQRELVEEGRLRSLAKERSLWLGVGHSDLEGFDAAGALRPVAFAVGGYSTGFSVPAEEPDRLVFREEREMAPWQTYAWASSHEPEYETISPLFSPWQLLYVDDVLDGAQASLGLDTLLLAQEEREARLEQLRPFLAGQHAAWGALDDAWRPLAKLLVALQNRYWPDVTKRTVVLSARPGEPFVAAGSVPVESSYLPSSIRRA